MTLRAEEFKLQGFSKAINTGKPQTLFDTDYFGGKRNHGTGWYIGAYEYSE